MAKSFINNKPAINMTVVGFGQAGTRIADNFASYKDASQKPLYNCLALNSNDGDLKGLRNIPFENRVSLQLGGLGKNPLKAIEILEKNEGVKEKLKEFIKDKVRPQDDLVLFCAGLGGGTGTSTIVKAIEEFFEFNNKPLINEKLREIITQIGTTEFKNDPKKYARLATKKAEDGFKKVGVVVTLPLRADGPDALRQVNEFAQRIWKIAQDKTKGVAFVLFADNQYFYDKFKNFPINQRNGFENYRDFANNEISETLHELNTATTGGGTEVTFDSQDFRRVILENNGCLVLNRMSKSIKDINTGRDVQQMFAEAVKGSHLHEPIDILKKLEDGRTISSKIHHLGLLAILDKSKQIGSSFLDDTRVAITENSDFSLGGTVFTGYLEEKNDHAASVYTFYKTDGLPNRLSKGLVKEFEEYQKRQKAVIHEASEIQSIQLEDDEDDFDIDLSELGLDESEVAASNEKTHKEDDLNIDELDIDQLLKD
ncbi:FtsZ/tubulin family protein [Bacillus swezeyi]|uniref:Cell division protein FtsZ n=1 Tax=Bacillus swezeyi TaxID=1925020 RepID=A0A5M8REA1_9BACI|nr:cell division protein FtsZ [Bacillus swezeyi]KAA6446905.1 cell division protein FtsZ [Bacillus swezeyi]KAA6471473.1 cell division protein FtsZ [Bacillus swezeyi]